MSSAEESRQEIIVFSQFTMESWDIDAETQQGRKKNLLRNISLTLYEKELVALLGPSGSGKSLISKILAGIVPAGSPSLYFTKDSKLQIKIAPDQDFCDISLGTFSYPKEALQGSIGFLFQNYSLFEDLSVEENICIGRDQSDFFRENPDRWNEWYQEVLEKLAIGRFLKTPVEKLSGGQKQRVALARVLASRPKIIFYDEPTSGLDPHIAKEVSQLIQAVHNDSSFGVLLSVVITHDYQNLLPIANRVLLLNVRQEIDDKTGHLEDLHLSLEQGVPPPQIFPAEEVLHHHKRREEALFNQHIDEVLRLPFQIFPHFRKNARWHWKWFRKFLNELLFRATILIFASGVLIGGLISYFSLTSAFSGKAGLIQPVLLEQLVSSLGLILWMALSPLFTALFLALRSGASIVGYLGNLKSSSQIDALSALHIQPVFLLYPGIFVAFTLGIPLMTFLHFFGASLASLFVMLATQPNTTRYFWWEWYFSRITPLPLFWVFLKGTLSGLGVSIICYRLGIKASNATEANRAIQNTIFYSILYILLSFFILLVLEQRVLR